MDCYHRAMAKRGFSTWHMAHIVLAIGWSDFTLKYRGSFLGYLWSLAAPLLRFLVILYVFQPLVGPKVPHYPLYLFLGLIIWDYFSSTTLGCMNMLHDKASIIQKIVFPRFLLILAVGCTSGIVFLTHFAIFVVFLWLQGTALTWEYLYLVPLLAQMTMMALGIGMLLSSYCLKYQDIRHIWEVSLQALFWMTPVTYLYVTKDSLGREAASLLVRGVRVPLHRIPDLFIRFQPLSVLMNDARRVFLYGDLQGIPAPVHMLAFTAACAILFTCGLLLFLRRSRYFLQEY